MDALKGVRDPRWNACTASVSCFGVAAAARREMRKEPRWTKKASLIKMEQSQSRAGQHRTQSERKEWVLLLCVPSRVGLTEILEADRREWSAGSVVMRARVLYDGKV